VLGLRLAVRVQPARVWGLGIVGASAVGLALLTSLSPVARLLDDVAATMPPVGILRDSHRYLGPAVLALVPGVAAATAWLLDRARPGREAVRLVALLVVVAPVLCLPSMAWGRAGDWQPVSYPAEWHQVRERLPPGRTVVLPWRGGYRGFEWNGRRATLDPAPRFFPGEVLIDDRLVVGSRMIASEDPLLRAVAHALDSGAPADGLRRLGVRSVLLEKGNGVAPADVPTGRVLHDGDGLTLVDLGRTRSGTPGDVSTGRQLVVVAVDVILLLTWLGALGVAVAQAIRPRP